MKRYRPLVNLILRAVLSHEDDLPPVTNNEIGKTFTDNGITIIGHLTRST